MSVWRRREGWAFAAAPGVNLAASLVVWYYHQELAFDKWWVLLLEANVIASAAVALVWLAARKRLYELRELSIGTSPLLAVQTLLGVVGSAFLLAPPVVRLAMMPADLPGWAAQVAEAPGWIAVLLAALAAAWYLRQVSPNNLCHVVGGLGLGVGVLATCSMANWTGPIPSGNWLAYHVLTASWAAVGLVVLAVGLLGRNLRVAGQTDPDREPSHAAGQLVLPGRLVGHWVTVIGAAAVALALAYCLEDPGRPWWSARAVLAAGVTVCLLAMWLRMPGYVYLSGLLVNVAGTVMWMAWEDRWTVSGLIHANVLCLGVGSCVWSLIRRTHPEGVPALRLGDRRLPFAHLAVQTGLATLGVLVVLSVVQNLWPVDEMWALWRPFTDRLGWLALGWLLPRMWPVWQALRIPDAQRREPGCWYPEAQAVVAGVAVVLGVWISIDFAFDGISRQAVYWISGRMAGPLAAAALLVAAILVAGRRRPHGDAGDRGRSLRTGRTDGCRSLVGPGAGMGAVRP